MEIDISRYQLHKDKRSVPHELAASVDEIIKEVGLTKQYNYGYWLFMVKRSRLKYNDILGILKEANTLSAKYNKGGFITNKLCPPKQKKIW
jgi:hypothetical protein